jgi:hypothetical protein
VIQSDSRGGGCRRTLQLDTNGQLYSPEVQPCDGLQLGERLAERLRDRAVLMLIYEPQVLLWEAVGILYTDRWINGEGALMPKKHEAGIGCQVINTLVRTQKYRDLGLGYKPVHRFHFLFFSAQLQSTRIFKLLYTHLLLPLSKYLIVSLKPCSSPPFGCTPPCL